MTKFTPRKFSDGISAHGRSLTLPYFWEPCAPLTQFWCMTVPARTRCPVQRHLCARDGCYHGWMNSFRMLGQCSSRNSESITSSLPQFSLTQWWSFSFIHACFLTKLTIFTCFQHIHISGNISEIRFKMQNHCCLWTKQQWTAATYVAATQKRQQGEHSTHWSPAPLILKLLSSLRTPLQRRVHGTDTPHHGHHTGHQHTTCFNTRVKA